MAEYLKRCESVTVKSKAKSDDSSSIRLISSKKRKLYSQLENEYCGGDSVVNSVSPAESRTSGGCSKHGGESNGVVNKSLSSSDLEMKIRNSNSEISPCFNGFLSEGEFCGDSEQGLMEYSSIHSNSSSNLKSPETSKRSRRRIPSEKTPAAAELEEFFLAAEKCERKRFAEKYNYDIVKDVPLEGKYQWVRLHH